MKSLFWSSVYLTLLRFFSLSYPVFTYFDGKHEIDRASYNMNKYRIDHTINFALFFCFFQTQNSLLEEHALQQQFSTQHSLINPLEFHLNYENWYFQQQTCILFSGFGFFFRHSLRQILLKCVCHLFIDSIYK